MVKTAVNSRFSKQPQVNLKKKNIMLKSESKKTSLLNFKNRWNFEYSQNFKKYLNETTLHGLRFIGDHTLTYWERGFFFCAFVAGIITTGHLISYFYTKWGLTPVIIATSPFPTAVTDIPFPAVTLCNVNQLQRSRVAHYSQDSFENALMEMACFKDVPNNGQNLPENYEKNNLSLPDFLLEHGPPCSTMFLSCQYSSMNYDCSELFREIVTDEGLCCIFNIMHPYFRYKNRNPNIKEYSNSDIVVPVNWSPQFGYQSDLPDQYYPRPVKGIGVSMGLTVVLNAEINEYYCSSTNGPGFKISVQNPTESPRIRQIGATVNVGKETRFLIVPRNSAAASNVRSLKEYRRCLFGDESDLKYYKSYTRINCQNECQASFIHQNCNCIPFTLPRIYANASVCGAPHHFCVLKSHQWWITLKGGCRSKCVANCFDLTYTITSFASSLTDADYMIQNEKTLQNFTKEYINRNIAVVHFYFKEFVFFGDVRSTYIGLTEFLSNAGGVLGLFLGFSFISVAELFYYIIMRPIFQAIKSPKQETEIKQANSSEETLDTTIWLGHELHHVRVMNIQNMAAYVNKKNNKNI